LAFIPSDRRRTIGPDFGMLTFDTLAVLAVVFLATFIRSAFGFGEALVAVPLLAVLMPVKVAAPVAVLVSITVAAVVVVQDWRKIHLRDAAWLILATLFGTPLGLWGLMVVPERVVKGVLACLIIAFSTYSLMRHGKLHLSSDRHAWLFGFAAGVLGGAYGMNGPPLVIYGSLRGWTPQRFRATLQGYFFPASTLVMAGYAATGLWVPAVTRYYLLSLPLLIVAILLGRFVNHRMSGRAFLVCVHVGLILIGAVLLYQSAAR
jgi:uncharacterized membrane protein YfcA